MKRYTVNEIEVEVKLFGYDEEEARNLTEEELWDKAESTLDDRGDFTPNETEIFETPEKALEYFNYRKEKATSHTFHGNCGLYGNVYHIWVEVEDYNEEYDEWELSSDYYESDEIRNAFYTAPITFNK